LSYPESVSYLYALGNELKAGAKFGLEPMQVLMEALGHPERESRFVHVAGTNGKGSTSAMIARVLQETGFAVGLYTSPHLIEPTERIQIKGQQISHEDFADAFRLVHDQAEELLKANRLDAHPSYFETVTAMAFVVFKQRADVTVLEVGLGGRLDATNVVRPELCVITPVSYDHEAYLGNTLQSIAQEKAGILKPGVPVVIAPQPPEVEEVIGRRAAELSCSVACASDLPVSVIAVSPRGSRFVLCGEEYVCPLPGRHQVENAVTAIVACKQLGMPEEAIQAGLKNTKWPGRLEYVSRDPDFVLDGAHNPAGAAALAAYIQEFCSDRPVWMVYAAMRDKALEEVAGKLFPLAERVILTAPDYPRALRPEAMQQLMAHPNSVLTGNVREAIDEAQRAPREGIVFFTGSLFLVGEARALLVK
jgi:dihydrofolate synthase/folylpolyglutamate synthase